MNVKKETVEAVKLQLTKEQNNLKYKCTTNAREMKKLGYENEIMKRSIAKYGELIKSLD